MKRPGALSLRCHLICEEEEHKNISIPEKQSQIKTYANIVQEGGQAPSCAARGTRQHIPCVSGLRVMNDTEVKFL